MRGPPGPIPKPKPRPGHKINPYEQAAKEWLKGCSCSTNGKPEECHQCTEAYLKRIKQLKDT